MFAQFWFFARYEDSPLKRRKRLGRKAAVKRRQRAAKKTYNADIPFSAPRVERCGPKPQKAVPMRPLWEYFNKVEVEEEGGRWDHLEKEMKFGHIDDRTGLDTVYDSWKGMDDFYAEAEARRLRRKAYASGESKSGDEEGGWNQTLAPPNMCIGLMGSESKVEF